MNLNLNELLRKSLTDKDLYKLFNNKIKIYTYNQLSNFNNIEDLFKPFDIAFILFETSKNYGHWCVLCTDKKTNYFFDPYGFKPDDELEFTNKSFRMKNNMWYPYLSYLLIKSNKKLIYNKYQLQDLKNNNIATCGRWCSLYAYLFDKLSIDEFANIFYGNDLYPDYAITLITNFE